MFYPRTLPCPNCNEIINDSMSVCKFCSMPIDPAAAHAAADVQEKVNRACNDASNIRNYAGAMWLFFLLRFVPLIGLMGWLGLWVTFLVVPVRLVIWFVRYSGVQTNDLDFKKAKRNILISVLLWLPAGVFMAFVVLAVLGAIL